MKSRKRITQEMIDCNLGLNEVFWRLSSKSRMSVVWFVGHLLENTDGIYVNAMKRHKYLDLLWYCNEVLVRSMSRKQTVLYVRNILNVLLKNFPEGKKDLFLSGHEQALRLIEHYLSSKRLIQKDKKLFHDEAMKYSKFAIEGLSLAFMVLADLFYYISGYKDHKHEKYFYHGLALDSYMINQFSGFKDPQKNPMENNVDLLDEKRGEVESDYNYYFWDDDESRSREIIEFGLNLLKKESVNE